MVKVTVDLDYPWAMAPDEKRVTFLVSGTPAAIHERFNAAFRGDRYLEVVDVTGDVWPFHLDTVRWIATQVLAS